METKEQNIITCSMMGGLVLGLVLVGCFLMTVLLPSFSLLLMIMLPVVYYRYIMRTTMMYKTELLNGEITYGRALLVGVYVSFFASTIVAVAVCIYCKWLNPEGFSEMLTASSQMWEKYAETPEQKEAVEQMSRTTAVDMAFSSIWSFTFLGVIVSLVTSFFAVRKNK